MASKSILLGTVIYALGAVFYSAFFIATANQSAWIQMGKIGVAAVHCFFLVLPVFLARSESWLLKALGYGLLAAFLLYAVFLVGFFQYFGFVPELYAYGAANLSDMGEVLDHYFAQVFGVREIALIVLGAILLCLTARPGRVSRWLMALPVLSVALFGASLMAFGAPGQSDRLGNSTLLRRFGPIVFGAHSAAERLSMQDVYLAAESPHPGPLARLSDLEHEDGAKLQIARPEGLEHVILVQIESFDPEAIDARLSGLDVMPFTAGLRDRCLSYTNYFTLKGAGGSADAEFAIATGLVPSQVVPSLGHFDVARRTTLYDRLSEVGVSSTFAHNNQAGFYGRQGAYARMEGVRAEFLQMTDIVGELAFAEEALARSLARPGRGFHYFFNFQSHGPYRGYSAETRNRFSAGASKDGLTFDYLATMSEVDRMIERLFEMQRPMFETGASFFVLTSDHPSYLFSDGSRLETVRVPFLMCHSDFQGREVATVSSPLDLHATILDLFGVEDGTALGRSLLYGGSNAALLPSGTLIRTGAEGHPVATSCGERCDPFFAYTGQYLRLGRPS